MPAGFRTLRQAVIEDFHLDASGAADDHVNRALCAALEDLRPMEFPFNQGTFTMDTVADQASYAIATKGGATANLLPWDFFGFLGQELKLDHEKAGNQPVIMLFADVETFKRERWFLNKSGTPRQFTFHQNKLWLGPYPPDSIDEVAGDYLKDLETPVPSYTGSAWEYLGADGVAITVSDDTFTNAWFTNAFDLLEARCAWRYFTTHDRNEKDATAANAMYQSALDKLERQRGPKQVTGRIVPFLGGSPGWASYGSRDYYG